MDDAGGKIVGIDAVKPGNAHKAEAVKRKERPRMRRSARRDEGVALLGGAEIFVVKIAVL